MTYRRVITPGHGVDALIHALQPIRAVVVGASAVREVAGLEVALRTLQASGAGDRVILLADDMTPRAVEDVALGLLTIREQTGGLVVTSYGRAEDPPLAQLRDLLAAFDVSMTQGTIDVLPALVRQLFLNLGVPETVATPEAVQQWLPAAGLAEAA